MILDLKNLDILVHILILASTPTQIQIQIPLVNNKVPLALIDIKILVVGFNFDRRYLENLIMTLLEHLDCLHLEPMCLDFLRKMANSQTRGFLNHYRNVDYLMESTYLNLHPTFVNLIIMVPQR